MPSIDHPSWIEYRNDSAERIPAFGIVRIAGLLVVEPGRVVLTANKPNTYGCQDQCAVNGPVPIQPGRYGVCTRGGYAPARYETSEGNPTIGEQWGPRNNSWTLHKQTGGFAIVGVTRAADGLVLVRPAPMLSFIGKTDAAHAKGATGTISIYAGTLGTPGSETDTGVDMTGVYNRFANVASGKWVRCGWNHDSAGWELVAAEC